MGATLDAAVGDARHQLEGHINAIFKDLRLGLGVVRTRTPPRAVLDATLTTEHHLFSKVILNFDITETVIASFVLMVEGTPITLGEPTSLQRAASDFVGWLSLAYMTIEALKKDPEWFRAKRTPGAFTFAGIPFPPGRRLAIHRLPDSVLLFADRVRGADGQLDHPPCWKSLPPLDSFDRTRAFYFEPIEVP